MKRYIFISVLMTMLFSTVSLCQEPFEPPVPPEEDAEHQMYLRDMELELQQREDEREFHQKMNELELQKQRIALQQRQKARQHPFLFRHGRNGRMLPFIAVCLVVNILLSIWVYSDIRRRNTGSGIWIVVALLTGILGALVYAVVRIGDIHQAKS